MPADRGAVASSCEEPRDRPFKKGSAKPGSEEMFMHPRYSLYYKKFVDGTNSLVECRGLLVGWSGAAYWASSFNDSVSDE